jgi:hypothetical protein
MDQIRPKVHFLRFEETEPKFVTFQVHADMCTKVCLNRDLCGFRQPKHNVRHLRKSR